MSWDNHTSKCLICPNVYKKNEQEIIPLGFTIDFIYFEGSIASATAAFGWN